jgi:hypothetical protein
VLDWRERLVCSRAQQSAEQLLVSWTERRWLLRFSHMLPETMIVDGVPTLVRLNGCDGLDTDLRSVGYRAVGAEIERHAHCVGRALVEVRGLHFRTLPRPPRPSNTVFGIEIDGERRTRSGFNSIAEAEQAAAGLVAQGRKVAIFDLVTGKIVKSCNPEEARSS